MKNNFNNDEFLISIKRFKIYGVMMIVLFIIFIFVIIHNIKLANEIESSKIIEHHKSAGKTRSNEVKTLKKRSKKWLTKRTPIAILNKLSRAKRASGEARKPSEKARKEGRAP